MTNEEAIESLESIIDTYEILLGHGVNSDILSDDDLDAIRIAIEALKGRPEGKWIPVTERLPKIADVYRVTRYYPNNVMNPNYLVDACFFDGSNTWYNDNRINHERAYVDNVIAWQENPEPYQKGGE